MFNTFCVEQFAIRVSQHLIKNMDRIRRKRKGEEVDDVDWTQAREVN